MAAPVETHDAAAAIPRPQSAALFRREALDHHLQAARENEGHVLRVSPPWTWALFAMLLVSVAVSVVFSFVAKVDITTKAKGVLRAPGGVRGLQTQVGGVVVEVKANSGQSVRAGDTLLRLESAAMEAALLEADRRLALVRSSLAAFVERQEMLYERRSELLKKRLALLGQRERSLDKTVGRFDKRSRSYAVLGTQGAVGSMTRDDAAEQLALAERQRLGSREELSQTKLQIAVLESERQADRWRWEQDVQEAQTKRNALAFSIEQMTIKAPQTGYLEALLVRPGDVVQPGMPVGRLVALGGPSRIVAFLQERDRAFVTVNSEIRVEVEQLPYAEFGTLRARVVRISSDLAPDYEVKEALGAEASLQGAVYRVELSLIDDEHARALARQLRPGMLVNTRFTLRQRRLIALALDPLRRWLH